MLTSDRSAAGVVTSSDKPQKQRSESSTSGIVTGDESDNILDQDEEVSGMGHHKARL